MANYESAYRTNYFAVTDEDKYTDLVSRLHGEDMDEWVKFRDGAMLHGFGGYGYISYLPDDNGDEQDIYDFFIELQKILPEGEAAIFEEVGNEKLRYLTGYIIFVTKDNIKVVDLQDSISDMKKEAFGEDSKITLPEY